MTPYNHPQYRALLAAVLASPADDLPRLVLADWLEENGEVERAEFIRHHIEIAKTQAEMAPLTIRMARLMTGAGPSPAGPGGRAAELLNQCATLWCDQMGVTPYVMWQWGWHRGFVVEVRCTLTDWCGGECHQCAGVGRSFPIPGPSIPCRRCGGSLVTGIGPRFVTAHPVERVTATDREPFHDGGAYYWFREGEGGQPRECAPPGVYAHLSGEWGEYRPGVRYYPTAESALDALSAALVAWAKIVSVLFGRGYTMSQINAAESLRADPHRELLFVRG